MSQFALRLPNSLHGYAKEVAQQDETSLNQFIVTAVAEKLSAMRTEEFFRERAAKAKPSRLDKILAKVPDTPPLKGDELS
jgi:hypothetical protein